jgi:hypothetical protein
VAGTSASEIEPDTPFGFFAFDGLSFLWFLGALTGWVFAYGALGSCGFGFFHAPDLR